MNQEFPQGSSDNETENEMSQKVPFTLKMHHVGIFVSNMDASLKWYEEVLGFVLVHRNIHDLPMQGLVDMAWMEHGNHYIELYEYPKNPMGEGKQRPFDMKDYLGSLGTKHICYYVDHAEYGALKAHLKAMGCNMPVDIRWPNDQSATPLKPLTVDADPETSGGVIYITDPDGIWIEIIEEYYPGVGATR